METSPSLDDLPSGLVGSMDEAVDRMRQIAGPLPPADGLACFNRMYLIVTQAVRTQVTDGFFADPVFMARLDVDFANRYFGAIDAYRAQPTATPRSWSVLLANRSDAALAPMQFALAGLNAHINLDLAVAVVKTCEDLNVAPDTGAHHADFEKVNRSLAALVQQVRQSFEQGPLLELDQQVSGLENLLGNFNIIAAREIAWVNAQVLWRIRGEQFLYDLYLDSIDRSVAFGGRTLLTPLPRIPSG